MIQAIIWETVCQNEELKDVPNNQLKIPVMISITGRMMCNNAPAYAVLANIIEQVQYEKRSNELVTDNLRISRYALTNRDGRFFLKGTRFVDNDVIGLNITHHCLPYHKRQRYRNCLTNVNFIIESDPKTTHLELADLQLDGTRFQDLVYCYDWPYEYPQYVKDYIANYAT